MRTSFFLPLLLVAGCASSSEPSAEGTQDFSSRGGITLEAKSDPELRISLMMLDGVQSHTKNLRFVKATVFRGETNFGAFCSLRGELEKADERAIVSCSMDVATVSDDDNEGLSFDLVLATKEGKETVTLEHVSLAGDGTFLGDEAKILGHEDEAPLALETREGDDLDKNVFALSRVLAGAVRPVLGTKVKSEEADALVVVKSASYSLETNMTMTTSLDLGQTGQLHETVAPISVLREEGNLAKGVLDTQGLAARLEASLAR